MRLETRSITPGPFVRWERRAGERALTDHSRCDLSPPRASKSPFEQLPDPAPRCHTKQPDTFVRCLLKGTSKRHATAFRRSVATGLARWLRTGGNPPDIRDSQPLSFAGSREGASSSS